MTHVAQVVASVCYGKNAESAHGRKKLDSELKYETKKRYQLLMPTPFQCTTKSAARLPQKTHVH